MSIETVSYVTGGGIRVRRHEAEITYERAIEPLIDALDSRPGVLLASSFEYPGRYTRWDVGFVDPPVEITCNGRGYAIRALNARGRLLLPAIANAVAETGLVEAAAISTAEVTGAVREPSAPFAEEDRTRQPTVFSVLRAIRDLFADPEDGHLGLYGAFGYDLAFQFDPVRPELKRPPGHRDLVLYLPDEILIVDHRRAVARRCRYDFEVDGKATEGLDREVEEAPFVAGEAPESAGDHQPGEFAALVRKARNEFAVGNLFEVVPGQVFHEKMRMPPSALFRRLREQNPAPYGALMNLGGSEYLVAASPEMFVRVEGRRIETCPISGTIARGKDAVEDAAQILTLLNSDKDEAELTMCTDVDRNDKSRVCEPGSVQIVGRRQIEMYSRLIHTVDHVEGVLHPTYDALDGFLTHCWAVTVTGAPKLRAMQFIEDNEKSPRAWYGGAIGFMGFNGNLNTGLTLRTARVLDGVAHVRAGATLLYDSDPEAEEVETRLKASAMLAAIRGETPREQVTANAVARSEDGPTVLMIDHQDSFVHMLASYFREQGARVVTMRHHAAPAWLDDHVPDLAVLSPGPGRPSDFDMGSTISTLLERDIPIFGVCLGLQGIVEYFGGELERLPDPVHGKRSQVTAWTGGLFDGLPNTFEAGRYHSLITKRDRLPRALAVTAETEEGVVMAVEHRNLPIAAVQFHPESLMSLTDVVGHRLILNVLERLVPRAQSAPALDRAAEA